MAEWLSDLAVGQWFKVDGEPFDASALEALRRRTAWVDPAVQLWNRPLLGNIHYGAGERRPPLPLALRVSELQAMLHRLPDGLATGLGEGGGLLSGGEGQRVRFARALQRREARLVILDEPFRALDRTQRRRLLQRARGYWSNATLFHVTHDLEETRSFDRVIVIEGGRIVEDGAPGELASRLDSRYSELLRAGEAVREELWGAAAWRRLWLEDGRFRRRAPRRRAVKERP